MSEATTSQRYLMVNVLLDPDKLDVDVGDLLHAIERAICDDDSDDHECPLMVMSSKGLTDEQHDLVLEQDAAELRAAGWVVLSPEQKKVAQRLGPIVTGAPARPYRRPRGGLG